MLKNEIKVDFSNTEVLRDIIEKAYFKDGFEGKILGKKHFITIKETDEEWHTFKDLNKVTVKVNNPDVIDGSMRFMIDESDGTIKLHPISIYCIKEEDKYIFY
jgi:hypothetical protein